MSSHPHGMRFSPFSATNKNAILSAQQQPQQQTPIQQGVIMRQQRKSATPTNIPIPTSKHNEIKNTGFSDTDDDEPDYFDEESDINLSREERYVLLQPRAEPQGQENLSGNVTPVNDNLPLNIFEKVIPSTPPTVKVRYSSASADATNQQQRYSNTPNNRSVSVDLRTHSENNGSQRNSLIIQQQQHQHSNRNSMDHPQSNRSSLDVSQSSYNTLIIHDNNDTQPLFSAPSNPGLIKHELYFINSSPSPPNYGSNKKEKSASRSFGNYSGQMHGSGQENIMTPITENEQQYLNQSYVLKHLAKEVKMSNAVESTRDSGVSENNSSSQNQNWSNDSIANSRNKSKSQPDLTKLVDGNDNQETNNNNSATNTLSFNDFEQLEVENTKLRQQLNDCFLKVSKSQKLEQEVANIYRVHEELVQSCERRERLERTARTRLQSDCRRLQDMNRTLREQVEMLQGQLISATTQQQQQLANTGRTQQDLLITQLIQQNKELVDANKRQYIEIQAQSATLEDQRIHINVLDSALKRLEEEVRQKQLYQKQLQTLLSGNERRDKLRIDLENELSKDLSRATPSDPTNLKWQIREKDNQIMRLEAECSKLEQRNNIVDENQVRKLTMDKSCQDTERIISEAHSAQRKVNELQTRLKMVENRLAEKEKEDIIRQLQEQKLYTGSSVGNSYSLLNNNDYTPSSSSIVSSTPTTPLIYNASNYENLMPSTNSSKTISATSNASFDALLTGAYSGIYNPNYGQKLSSVPPASNGMSPNTSCSSAATIQQHQHQQPSTTSSSSNASNYLNYDPQCLDEQRKSIDDQLKKLDNQLLTKVSELTLIQQQHIQLQQQQNRNLKSKNAALIHNSRASSLSLCTNPGSTLGSRSGITKTVDVTNNLKSQNARTNSMQSLSISYGLNANDDIDHEDENDGGDEEEKEIFY